MIRSKSGRCAAGEFITYGRWPQLAANSLLLLLPIVQANAQSAPPSPTVQSGGPTQGSLDEIIVTAQKRQQAITDVGMAITAVSADQLERQGIKDVGDLAKLEPSFNVSQAQYGTPVYSIRGVGYNEQALAASPAVSVYVDEFPYAYPALTRGATLDLARVEVLKGPQGTLYGQNATGGAINYIAAKPTDSWQGKLEGTYARFNSRDLNGFVSGPLTDTLKARVAFDVIRGGAWQSSYTRDDHIGDTRQGKARILLDWDPAESFKLTLNVNGWVDQSDTPVTQLLAITLLDPQFAKFVPNLVNYPLAPQTSRAADWNPAYAHVNDEHFYQAALRADYSVSSALRITSLTSYEHYRQNNVIGNDGMNVNGNSERQTGTVKSISQELRADGTVLADKLNWLLGLDYARDETNEYVIGFLPYTTPAFAFTPFGLGSFSDIAFSSNPTVKTRAAFGNLEYRIQDYLSVHGGVRYTKSDIDYNGCLYGIDPVFVAGANGIQSLVKQGVGVIPINLGDCVTFDSQFNPGLVRSSLNEHNVSWRTGVDWHPSDGALVYASVSKGYKAGSFPTLPGTGAVQFNPVTQESLLAYEVGLKTTFTPKLALDLSVFHYDYKNKQLRGRILDPTGVFGIIDALVNIPKSEEDGAELSLRWRPVGGLSLSAAATYLDPKVKHGFHTIDVFTGKSTDFTGYGFPATPKWTVASGAQYDWILPNGMNMYFGADYRYQTAAPSVFEDRADTSLGYPSLDIGSYGLLDLRAGVDSSNGKWGIRVFGNNVTNRYYWTEASRIYDTAVRYPGMPVTFGLTATYRFSQ